MRGQLCRMLRVESLGSGLESLQTLLVSCKGSALERSDEVGRSRSVVVLTASYMRDLVWPCDSIQQL